MIDLGKRNLLGIGINAIDYEASVNRVRASAKAGVRCTVTALAVHGVMTGVFDREQRYRLNRFDLVVPDGQPVRWAINLLYSTRLLDRVYGPNLMLKTCEMAAKENLPIFLFGGTDEMLRQLAARLIATYPSLSISGMEPSKFRCVSTEENLALVQTIRNSGAKITFCGIGCPRQETWAFEIGELVSMPILAVGAAFAFHAGQLSQAPEWMQKFGLEWLYRVLCEPRRLWRRYLFLNPAYLFLVAIQLFRISKFDPSSDLPPRENRLYG